MKKVVKTLFITLMVCILFGTCDVYAARIVNPNVISINDSDPIGVSETEPRSYAMSFEQASIGSKINYMVKDSVSYNFKVISKDTNEYKIIMMVADYRFYYGGTSNKTAAYASVMSRINETTASWINVNRINTWLNFSDSDAISYENVRARSIEFDDLSDGFISPIKSGDSFWVNGRATPGKSMQGYYDGVYANSSDLETARYVVPVVEINYFVESDSLNNNNNNSMDDNDSSDNDDSQKNEYDKIPDELYDVGNNKISDKDVIVKDDGQVVTNDGKNVYDKNGKLVYLKDGQQVKVDDTLKMAYIGYVIGIVVLILGIMVLIQTFRKNKEEEIY